MLSQILLFAAGLACLIAGAEALVRGAAQLALSMRVSPLLVGLTVVAFGTSSPEMAVTVGAALSGRPDIAVGNVVGSNIINVLFILGLSAVVAPLVVHLRVVRQEVPVMIATSAAFAAVVLDGALARAEAVLLVSLLVAYTGFLVWQARAEEPQQPALRKAPGRRTLSSWAVQASLVLGGLLLLALGARWLVEAATVLAQAMGLSDLVIGLTVVALGTSLPEAATSVAAAARGARDIAVGNVVGSNIFNVLGCLGLAGLVSPEPLPVAPAVLNFDLWVMLATAFACLPIFLTGHRVGRREGALLLAYFAAYVIYVVLDAQKHDALPPFSAAMMSFVVPLTIVTLLIALLRPRGKRRSR
jgi:cation:H+ antiporter